MREDFEYPMEDGTTSKFSGPMTLQETYADEEEGFANHISYLPKNWEILQWWLIECSTWVDDLRVAFECEGKHYVIHDCVCEERTLEKYGDVYDSLYRIAEGEDLQDEE